VTCINNAKFVKGMVVVQKLEVWLYHLII